MAGDWYNAVFSELILNGTRNGIYKRKEFHGSGTKIVNMGELFTYPRLKYVPMNRVELTETELERFTLNAGDLIFARRSLVAEGAGKCSIVMEVNEPTTFESSIIRVRPNPQKVHSLFLYYLFNSPKGKYLLGTILRQVAVSGITGNDLSNLQIPFPQLELQQAIAHILGTLDDKIELNRKMNNTLEATAKALFKSWFVDFDPVRAKAEGRDTGLPKHIADLFPDSFVDSELGEIPRGWSTKRLGEIFTLDKGLSYKGQYLADNGTPMVNLGCFIGQGKFSDKAVKHYTGEFKSRHIIIPGDIVIANTDITQKREVLGSPAIVPILTNNKEVIFTHHVFAVRFKDDPILWRTFIFYSLLQDEFRDRAKGFATGTTVLALPRDAILDHELCVPDMRVMRVFNQLIIPFIEKNWSINTESQTLTTLRDTLLPNLISGDLRIKDAERFVERIAS
jgi:type I restriction enzyme, S subunit